MKLLHILVVFATLGLALAKDFFATIGLEASYPLIGAFGLAVTTLLVFRGWMPLLAAGVLAAMVSLPEDLLLQYHLDHDVLLAVVLTLVLFPWIRKIAHDG